MVPIPVQDESFVSWIDRIADDHQVSRVRIWNRFAILRDASIAYASVFDRRTISAISQVTGAEPETIAPLLWSGYSLSATPTNGLRYRDSWTVRNWAEQHFIRLAQSNACPQCLADSDGAWQLPWRLGLNFMCLTHGRYLISFCRECGTPLQSSRMANQRRYCSSHRDHSGRVTYQPCSAPIARASTTAVRSNDAIENQKSIQALIHPERDPARAGLLARQTGLSPRRNLAQLRSAMALVLYQGTPANLGACVDPQAAARFQEYCEARDRRQIKTVWATQLGGMDPLTAAATIHLAAPMVLADRQVRKQSRAQFLSSLYPDGRTYTVPKFVSSSLMTLCTSQERSDLVKRVPSLATLLRP